MVQWLAVFCIIIVTSLAANAQTLSGLKIGDPAASISSIGLDPIARNLSGPLDITKFKLSDKNELTITINTQTNKIVSIENDWGGNPAGTFSYFPGFFFGKTTLGEIRRKFGSDGIGFTRRSIVASAKYGSAGFSSYEVADVIVSFVTLIMIDKKELSALLAKHSDAGEYAHLNGIILISPDYARIVWGNPIKDPDYKPIQWR